MEELGLTITQLVELYLPTGFSVSEDYLKKQTRLYQLLLWDAANVPESDKYELENWPEEWQLVIGYLILWAIFQKVISDSFMNALGAESSTEGTTADGGVKKITTGPTEVEYYDNATSLANLLKEIKGPEGIMGQIISLACPLGRRLGIKLPFCDAVKTYLPFSVVYPKTRHCCTPIEQKILDNEACNKPASMG